MFKIIEELPKRNRPLLTSIETGHNIKPVVITVQGTGRNIKPIFQILLGINCIWDKLKKLKKLG